MVLDNASSIEWCETDEGCPLAATVCLFHVTDQLDRAFLQMETEAQPASPEQRVLLENLGKVSAGPPGCACSPWFSWEPDENGECSKLGGAAYGAALAMGLSILLRFLVVLSAYSDLRALLRFKLSFGDKIFKMLLMAGCTNFLGLVWEAMLLIDPIFPLIYNGYKGEVKTANISYVRSFFLAGYCASTVIATISIVVLWLENASEDISRSGNKLRSTILRVNENEKDKTESFLAALAKVRRPLFWVRRVLKVVQAIYVLIIFVVSIAFTSDAAIVVSVPFVSILSCYLLYARVKIVETLTKSKNLEVQFINQLSSKSGHINGTQFKAPSLVRFDRAIRAIKFNSSRLLATYLFFIVSAGSYVPLSGNLTWKNPSLSPLLGVSIPMVNGLIVQLAMGTISFSCYFYTHVLAVTKVLNHAVKSKQGKVVPSGSLPYTKSMRSESKLRRSASKFLQERMDSTYFDERIGENSDQEN